MTSAQEPPLNVPQVLADIATEAGITADELKAQILLDFAVRHARQGAPALIPATPGTEVDLIAGAVLLARLHGREFTSAEAMTVAACQQRVLLAQAGPQPPAPNGPGVPE